MQELPLVANIPVTAHAHNAQCTYTRVHALHAGSQSSHSPFSNSSPAAVPSLRPRYVAWAGAVSTTAGCIELPAHLCSSLQLPSGCEVVLEGVAQLAAAAAVVVEPVGPADWEVVELNAGLLEEHVLGQVRGAGGEELVRARKRGVGVPA